jgi:hypothetical protein
MDPQNQTPVTQDNTQQPMQQQPYQQPMQQQYQQPMQAQPIQPAQQYQPQSMQQQPYQQPMQQQYQQPMQALPIQPAQQYQPQPMQQQYQQPQPMQAPTQPQSQPLPQLNDELLIELGFGSMDNASRDALLQQMKQTLEMRVGMEIYKHMRDDQLREFEGLMPANDENGNVLLSPQQAEQNSVNWLNLNIPGWQNSPQFGPYANQPGAVLNFAALNWLQRNFPSYKDVVAKELNGLLEEVKRDKDAIIGTIAPQSPAA